MSTDLPDGNEGQRGTSGRTPRLGDARSPVGSTLSVVLAVIAVVAGFLILRELTDDDGGGTSAPIGGSENSAVETTAAGSGGPSTSNALGTATTATTVPGRTLAGATISVVNVSGQGGSASAMSSALETAGYLGVGAPGDGTGADQDVSSVYYVPTDPAAQAVAASIAADLGGVPTAAMPATRPAQDGDTATATVLVMLGADAAGKSLSELSGTAAVATPTPSP
jgi:hypothetical protein